MNKYIVIKNRKGEAAPPIVVEEGEVIICEEESDPNGDWPGWVMCSTEKANGWLPRQILDRNNEVGIILEDYSSIEFDIEVDEVIIEKKTINNWIWGYKESNPSKEAWAPLNHLKKL